MLRACLPIAVLLMLIHVSGSEWVEIPHLTPSSSVQRTSISATIKPLSSVNVGGGDSRVLAHSHLLLSHLSNDRESSSSDSKWPASGTSVRWHRPVSDLLDYEKAHESYSQTKPWITGGKDSVVSSFEPVAAVVNVSNKVEPWRSHGVHSAGTHTEAEDAEDEEEYDEDLHEESNRRYPIVQTELLPFGNRYEEESIETAPEAPMDRPKVVQTSMNANRFDDFDDYDERGSPWKQQGHVADAPEDDTHEETDEPEQEYEEEQQQNVTPVQPDRTGTPAQLPQPVNGLAGFLDFLRRMQASFVKRTAHTIGDKIRTLTDMRDQLLSSIEQRIASLWLMPNAGRSNRKRRVRRGWMDPHASNDAMDFPSAEGALLTISFLTFAVFLIKLVLQVINTIKAKHYTYSTFTAATPVSGGLLVKRTKRHTEQDFQAILNAIDGYRPT
ncbi:uncharacterized protein LOC128728404 [Anopheles nili]|uniref:uncharacterized protein LOC128728404 n=1 Tax=Anopheles nili TaxID=185578 RepID=UPI00237BA7BE|nr:uncharacterized protein LOC128728404 [Anopheles nili]